jgi:anti-anti-sigma factor
MSANYRLIQVEARGDTLLAVLDQRTLMEPVARDALRHDFLLLIEQKPRRVELDLKAVEYMDGALTSQLIQLWKRLKDSEATLLVIPSPVLAEILEITKLDRLFEVVDAPRIVG